MPWDIASRRRSSLKVISVACWDRERRCPKPCGVAGEAGWASSKISRCWLFPRSAAGACPTARNASRRCRRIPSTGGCEMSSRSRAARNGRGGWAFLGRIVVPSGSASREFPRTSARRGGNGENRSRKTPSSAHRPEASNPSPAGRSASRRRADRMPPMASAGPAGVGGPPPSRPTRRGRGRPARRARQAIGPTPGVANPGPGLSQWLARARGRRRRRCPWPW